MRHLPSLESPLNRFKDGTSLRIDVQGVTFFTRGTGIRDLAQVRYLKEMRRGNGGDEQRSYWIATVQYAYVAPAKDPRKRQWNPLGLRIVEFRAEAEVVSAQEVRKGGDTVPLRTTGAGR